MRKVALLGIVVMLLAVPGVFAGDKSDKLPEGQEMAKITVSGMTCGGCTNKVETAVGELDGVVKVKADYEKNVATVVFEKDKVDVNTIVKTINEKTSFKAEAPKTS